MELQYDCGHRQITQLAPSGKHPNDCIELKPGETAVSKLKLSPDATDTLVIDASGPVTLLVQTDVPPAPEASDKATPKPAKSPKASSQKTLTRPLIWQDGNGTPCPIAEGKDPVSLTVGNPSDSTPITVRIVAIPKA